MSNFIIKYRGDCTVDSVNIIHKTDDVVLLEVNTSTKYVDISSSCDNGFMISTSERSLYKGEQEGDTWIEIPEAEGYSFFSGSGGRYTLSVTFVKRSIYNV